MFMQSQSKGLELAGNPCPEIGARTGRATPISMAKTSLFKSPPVMVGPSQVTTWHHLVGSLAKPFKVVNFKVLTKIT